MAKHAKWLLVQLPVLKLETGFLNSKQTTSYQKGEPGDMRPARPQSFD